MCRRHSGHPRSLPIEYVLIGLAAYVYSGTRALWLAGQDVPTLVVVLRSVYPTSAVSGLSVPTPCACQDVYSVFLGDRSR